MTGRKEGRKERKGRERRIKKTKELGNLGSSGCHSMNKGDMFHYQKLTRQGLGKKFH